MKSHNLFGCYVDEMMKIYLIACWICWLALAYPFCCMWCMWLFFLAMIINLVDGSRWARSSWSARKWRFCRLVRVDWSIFVVVLFFRAMALYVVVLGFVNFRSNRYSVLVGIALCLVVEVALWTPGLHCWLSLCDVSFNFTYIN